jgi:hypothetical protein
VGNKEGNTMPTTRKYRRLKGLDYFNCSKIGVRRKLRLACLIPVGLSFFRELICGM